MISASRGHLEVVQCLLDHGANIEGKHGNNGGRALHHAILDNRKEVIGFLLDKGADTESTDYERNRPLHFAAGLHLTGTNVIKLFISLIYQCSRIC